MRRAIRDDRKWLVKRAIAAVAFDDGERPLQVQRDAAAKRFRQERE